MSEKNCEKWKLSTKIPDVLKIGIQKKKKNMKGNKPTYLQSWLFFDMMRNFPLLLWSFDPYFLTLVSIGSQLDFVYFSLECIFASGDYNDLNRKVLKFISQWKWSKGPKTSLRLLIKPYQVISSIIKSIVGVGINFSSQFCFASVKVRPDWKEFKVFWLNHLSD